MQNPSEYDDIEKKCLPNLEAFFGTVLDFINPSDKKILELASGTGFLTEMIVKKSPESRITCVDCDSAMIEVAKSKPELSKVNFIVGDMRDYKGGGFDVVIITQGLLFIDDSERKPFFDKIMGMLNEGGRFIAGDMFAPESDFEKELYKKLWIEDMIRNKMTAADARDMIAPLDDYCRENTVSTFVSELEGMGFSPVIVPYISGYYGVVVAYR
ncbi:MAG: class I SAM-dependent methyltransferase [Methanomicrobiaceae archaeon]|nr:class I SAM-dependent methyltransferase [Methanomicrobiaceae archaeon]